MSLSFASANPSATPIWPPTGIAIGLLVLRGYRFWPAIYIGALVANLLTSGAPGASVAIAGGNAMEAVTAAGLLSLWGKGPDAFRTPAGIGRFAAIAAGISTPISATVGAAALALAGFAPWPQLGPLWTTWWLGDLAGALVVAPVIVLLAHPRRRPAPHQLGEAGAVLAFAAVVGLFAYSPWGAPAGAGVALAFLAVLPLMWSALRGRRTQTALVALELSAFAVWGVAAHAGPFLQPAQDDSFQLLAIFMIAVSTPSLALAAAVAEGNRALGESEQMHRLLVEGAREYAITMLDPKGRVLTWNPGAAKMKGYAAADIVGRPFGLFYIEEERLAGAPEQALAQALSKGVHRSTGWRVRADGSRFWASSVINAVHDQDGELVGFANVVRDLTEVRDAEEALGRAQAQLLQSKKLEAIGQLAGGVAHDFNNLLTIIQGQVERLRMRSRDGLVGEPVEAIQAAAERGARLTRQLLSFSRRQTLNAETVELGSCIGGVRAMLAAAMPRGVEIELDAAPDAWPVTADRSELELAVINLLMNARDAMPDGGKARICVRNVVLQGHDEANPLAGEFAAISVSDSGVGMPADVLARAFDPFFTTKGADKGTGLGLSQVHGFAHQSGGGVTAESAQGAGTTITLYLPRAAEQVHAAAATG